MWRATQPGFDLDSLWLESRGRWRASWVELPHRGSKRGGAIPWEDDLTAEVFTVTSPDSAFDLEIDTYQAISDEGGEISVGGEPDSRSALYDRGRNCEAVLVFSGTPLSNDWGRWFGSSRFALAGLKDASDMGQWMQGWISIYSGADSSVSTYVTRPVPASAVEGYRESWKKWVIDRYRALRRGMPSS